MVALGRNGRASQQRQRARAEESTQAMLERAAATLAVCIERLRAKKQTSTELAQ